LGKGVGQFRTPHGVAVDGNGSVYVVEWTGNRLQKFCSSTVGISLTVKIGKEHSRKNRVCTRRNYNPENYDIKKNDQFLRIQRCSCSHGNGL
jgi:hypothetical protein|tara:strand:- start:1215 stop:1490 length:276 start_codon:yes stop_codon:yes gene_type:complete